MNKPQPNDYDGLFDLMPDESSPDPDAELPEGERDGAAPAPVNASGLTPQQKAYAENAALRAEVERELDKAVKQCLERLTQANPALAKFGCKPQNRLYRKRPPGFSKVVLAIADRLSGKGRARGEDKQQARQKLRSACICRLQRESHCIGIK